jgi:hypothetical protein
MSATQAKNEIYEPKKLDAIYQNIVANNQIGKTQDYEIRVDDFPVVGKNNDPERFMSYADFITPDTKHVTVKLYRSNGQSDKYFFHLQPGNLQNGQLKGFESGNSKIVPEEELRDRLTKELHYEELLKENAALKLEVEDYEKLLAKADQELNNVKAGRDISIVGWGKLLGEGLYGLIKEKTGYDGVAGVNTNTTENKTEESASFKRKNEAEDIDSEEIKITDKERGYLMFIEDVRTRIGDYELANVMHLLDLMAANPHSIAFALRQVTYFIKQKRKEENNEQV